MVTGATFKVTFFNIHVPECKASALPPGFPILAVIGFDEPATPKQTSDGWGAPQEATFRILKDTRYTHEYACIDDAAGM